MELPSDNCSATYNRDSKTLKLKGNRGSTPSVLELGIVPPYLPPRRLSSRHTPSVRLSVRSG